MANSIALFKQYTTLLDEKLRQESLTSDLDGAAELVREGANANELVIQKMSVDGLGKYDKANGYTAGDVTLTNETVACNFDRSRSFTVDAMDDIETAGMAFGRLAGVFIKDKVVPELDAFRFSTYASAEGVGTAYGTLSNGTAVIAALRAATTAMDNAEVPYENRILYITPDCKGMVDDIDLTKSRMVLDRFSKIVIVPQTRLLTKITQYDGTTVGQTAGGYVKKASEEQNFTGDGTTVKFTVTAKPAVLDGVTVAGTASTAYTYDATTGEITFDAAPANSAAIVVSYGGGRNINFLIVQKDAIIQFNKHVSPKVITPEANQTADAWKFGYRNVGIAEVYENKLACIYVHADVK